MCGISGVLNFKNQKVDEKDLLLMCGKLKHRGPDDECIWLNENGDVGLGSRRLSVIDVEGGRQPIHNEDQSLQIVFNGEIYNFQKLRESLRKKRHRFYTRTDTECILHLYEEEGENFVKRLDGMFALAIWDEKKQRLLLARDPIGKKPLYWAADAQRLVFASEIKGILALPAFKREIDQDSLAKYFFYSFVPTPATVFKNIKKVLPGHVLEINKKGEIKEKKYWEIDYSKKLDGISARKAEDEIIKLLYKAVEKRLAADVPVGLFLSGGIDSGLVGALMADLLSPQPIDAFSLGFEEDEADEVRFARKTAEFLGARHHLRIMKSKEVFKILPDLIKMIDEPMGDPSIIPTFFLSKFAGEKIKVALSGDGGDENFAGYPKYLAHLFLRQTGLEKLPFRFPAGNRFGRVGKVCGALNLPLYKRNQVWISSFSVKEIKDLVGQEPDLSDLEKYHQSFNGADPLDEAFFLDQKLTLTDLYLTKVDRASMAASLEVRCPFLDRELVKFSAKVPARLKMKNFTTKYLLKQIAKDFLPKEIINRPKKGFGIPLKRWLAGELMPFLKEYLPTEKIRKQGILNYRAVDKIVREGEPFAVWKLLVFEIWREHWLK